MPGQKQRREPGVRQRLGRGGDPFVVGVQPEAVVEARTAKPVAMGDLDRVDAGGVEREADSGEIVDGVLVPDRVHAVSQRHVLE